MPLSPIDLWRNDETCAAYLERRGVSRRQFLGLCGRVALLLGCGGLTTPGEHKALARDIAGRLAGVRRPTVVWLQLQECTGCLESALRSGDKTLEDLVVSLVSLDYNELLMAPSGDQANAALADALTEPHLLVVNGSVPVGNRGSCCAIGGESAEELLRKASRNASAIVAVGACAHYGCIQAAHPNPTGAVGVADIIRDRQVVSVAGCPPIGEVVTATLLYYVIYGHPPLSTTTAGRCSPTASASTINARAVPTTMPASSSSTSTTTAPARGTVSTRWGARGRPPSPPARSWGGTSAPAFPSRPATPALAARSATSSTA